MGFSRAALRAGYQPKKIPTSDAAAKDIPTALGEIKSVQPFAFDTKEEAM